MSIDFMGEASDKLGRFINEFNNRIDTQDVQIEQLANMVNLIGKVEGQQKEIKLFKSNHEEHHKVIALEECVEDVQKKVFPQVGKG
jgi:hypothetical protein